ncbi:MULTISPECIES: tetratricopeptide repeat protein [unclassified Tenacibaculum]|uniref:tetratricopeptide repeat protein n=1 Tax=unclassified Tenacibaculum TaxID=2635139 RepID=UPI001F3D50CB|nr:MULTISPECIES: tetratricopeptide repeat protein [unclassified Tenacibaculum]MCF2874320.1 tetratricopeptide repeat protein [Tenacibaculum sp. Cn5-1]MCF2934901.1 tetratricopeptide repeat protein [Tenacibaculum sp. Cn5-34]MCG7511111.1 tetratricopeptide repeat protein [Tenacibaculum sp. Cn5-46]
MKKVFKTLIAVFIVQIGFSQEYQTEFLKHLKANDTINQLKVLTKWESINPKDPELYTSYFNYYFMKSQQEVLMMSSNRTAAESLVLKDSLNQTAGYIESKIHYDQIELEKAFHKISEAIELFPNRLDMRFGKIYALGEVLDWKNFTSEIIKTIKYSITNNNNWTWTNNEKYNSTTDEFLLDIQNYQLQLYNTGEVELLNNMREIAEEILKHYPNHIQSLSNLSITYLLTDQYDKAIEVLLKAEKIDPKDHIVLANIAQGYKLKGNKNKAIEYYKKTIEFGDQNAKEYAKQQIIELRK